MATIIKAILIAVLAFSMLPAYAHHRDGRGYHHHHGYYHHGYYGHRYCPHCYHHHRHWVPGHWVYRPRYGNRVWIPGHWVRW